jgi:3-isopropylmalate dehydrogenase
MLLRHSLALETEARAVGAAVGTALDEGQRTADLATSGEPAVTTQQMGDRIVRALLTGQDAKGE